MTVSPSINHAATLTFEQKAKKWKENKELQAGI